jgi:polysaccharide biosynthesis/export protein
MTRGILVKLLLCTALSGCSMAWDKPGNSSDMNGADAYMAERRDVPDSPAAGKVNPLRWNAQRCTTPEAASSGTQRMAPAEYEMPMSPGDLVHVGLPGDDAPTGNYRVDSNGTLSLDVIGKLPVTGVSVQQAEAEISRRLVALGHYRSGHARVTLRLLDRAAVRATVSGAVFQPGQVVINQRGPQDTDPARQNAAGDHAIGRSLSVALSNAAGVRPDADIAHITVDHAGARQVVDLTGLLDGHPVNDVLLVDGDHIEVPSRNCFQAKLARPSPITPAGVRVFLSNLTTPASSNAASAVGRDQTSLPYGTRFLQALVSANCVGGTQTTNADRWAVLISANPISGESEVVERRIEALVRRSDRDGFNPVVLPGDAVACYDSMFANLRDVVRTIGDLAISVGVARAVIR